MKATIVLLICTSIFATVYSSEIIHAPDLTDSNYEEWKEAVDGLKLGAAKQLVDEEKLKKYRDEIRDKMISYMENTDFTGSFPLEETDLTLTPTNKLKLNHGTISNFAKIHVPKDEKIEFNSSLDKLTWDIPVEFDKLQFNYQYNSKMSALDNDGVLEGTVSHPKYLARISYSVQNNAFSLDELIGRSLGFTNTVSSALNWIEQNAWEAVKRNGYKALILTIDKAVWMSFVTLFNILNEVFQKYFAN